MPTDGRCPRCYLAPWPFAQARSSVHYGGAIATALLRFKHGRQDIARSLIPLALAAVATTLGALPAEGRRLIVPVPLHGRRLRVRGFNQAAALARGAARMLPSSLRCEVNLWCLARVRDGAHVAHESVAARHQRAKDAFAVRHAARMRGCHVVLVDDVLTTGATSCACAEVLLKAGAKSVSVATVARAL